MPPNSKIWGTKQSQFVLLRSEYEFSNSRNCTPFYKSTKQVLWPCFTALPL